MAFMTVPVSGGAISDRTPVLGYNAKSGRLFLHDRVQDDGGEWGTVKTDVTMQQPAFAVDFGRLEIGWIHFAADRAPIFAMAPYGQPEPAEPEVLGSNATTGKPLRCKRGFRVPAVGRAIGGVREFAGNSGALIAGMNELHSVYEEAPEARAGKLPLVKLTDVSEVRAGQSSNYQPVFTVVSWVDRPESVLGPRTVAPPGAPIAALRMAAPPTRHATRESGDIIDAVHRELLGRGGRAPIEDDEPPAGRWDDAPPPGGRQVNGARTATRSRF